VVKKCPKCVEVGTCREEEGPFLCQYVAGAFASGLRRSHIATERVGFTRAMGRGGFTRAMGRGGFTSAMEERRVHRLGRIGLSASGSRAGERRVRLRYEIRLCGVAHANDWT
jgi:hypothetical protein